MADHVVCSLRVFRQNQDSLAAGCGHKYAGVVSGVCGCISVVHHYSGAFLLVETLSGEGGSVLDSHSAVSDRVLPHFRNEEVCRMRRL